MHAWYLVAVSNHSYRDVDRCAPQALPTPEKHPATQLSLSICASVCSRQACTDRHPHKLCCRLVRTFDFDADERWQSYRQKLEFPAGSDEAALLQRMKKKWYKREIDPSFDAGQRELHCSQHGRGMTLHPALLSLCFWSHNLSSFLFP